MKFGVVVFPGSNCDMDMVYVLETIMGQEVVKLWHKDTDLKGCEFIIWRNCRIIKVGPAPPSPSLSGAARRHHHHHYLARPGATITITIWRGPAPVAAMLDQGHVFCF